MDRDNLPPEFSDLSDKDLDRIDAAADRMAAAQHAIQSGVAMELNDGLDAAGATPKYLRVGVNTALCETSALGRLLIQKGLITWPEYYESMATELEREKQRYKDRLKKRYGGRMEVDLA